MGEISLSCSVEGKIGILYDLVQGLSPGDEDDKWTLLEEGLWTYWGIEIE